jgi:hypothetical protein
MGTDELNATNADGHRYHNIHGDQREHRDRPTDVTERTFADALRGIGRAPAEATLPRYVVHPDRMADQGPAIMIDYHKCMNDDGRQRRGDFPRISASTLDGLRAARRKGFFLCPCSAMGRNQYPTLGKDFLDACADAARRYAARYDGERLWWHDPILVPVKTGPGGKAETARRIGCIAIIDDNQEICREAYLEGIITLPVATKRWSQPEGPWWFWFRGCIQALEFVAERWSELIVPPEATYKGRPGRR